MFKIKVAVAYTYAIVLAAAHHTHLQAIEAIRTLPTKVGCTYWCRGSSETGEQSTRPHHSWRQRLCQQLLLGPLFSKISPIFSPRLRDLSYIRVPPNSKGSINFSINITFPLKHTNWPISKDHVYSSIAKNLRFSLLKHINL